MLKEGYRTYGTLSGSEIGVEGEVVKDREKVEYIFPKQYRITGRHDRDNALAAWTLCQPFMSGEVFSQALETFQKPPHRIEFICEIEGVRFYDDSKGTNVDAVCQAVGVMEGPIILIVGGVDKGASYTPWVQAFLKKVKRIIALGQAAPRIYKELNPFFEIECVDSLAAAVQNAAQKASKGDCVLLSPGCSSYDMFYDYAQRGREFQRCVRDLNRPLTQEV